MRLLRNVYVVPVMMCGLAACSANPPTGAEPGTPLEAGDRPVIEPPPPGAPMKPSSETAGNLSPVPDFSGQGGAPSKRWTIQIRSVGEMRHHLEFAWTNMDKRLEGEVFYRDVPTVASEHAPPIMLDGTLNTENGKKTIRVEIATEPCADDNIPYFQRVKVAVEGESELNGCGALAVY